jgi:hypothetical protein
MLMFRLLASGDPARSVGNVGDVFGTGAGVAFAADALGFPLVAADGVLAVFAEWAGHMPSKLPMKCFVCCVWSSYLSLARFQCALCLSVREKYADSIPPQSIEISLGKG